jgi:hypothetical protein
MAAHPRTRRRINSSCRFIQGAVRELRHRLPGMMTLIALAIHICSPLGNRSRLATCI